MNRRTFLQSTAALSGLLIVSPKTAFGYEANSAVRLGLLGCGGRGTAVATSFAKKAGARVVALADIFPDKLALGKTHFDEVNAGLGQPAIDPRLMFHGHTAFQQLSASREVDAIQISTPPFFHVEHLEGVVNAGKHAYCEKPVGVDMTQSRHALEISKKASGKVSIDVGFQIRSAPPFVEMARRIHAGQIGSIAAINAYYNAPAATYPDHSGMPADEKRLREWLWDRTLSGDILLEQNIHVIDICNWMMQAHPVSAVAKSSRMVVKNPGNTSDNYQVIFTYPGNVRVSFSSTQFGDGSFFEVSERIFGTAGIADSPYSGAMQIQGENPWVWKDDQAPANAEPAKFAANGAFSDNLALADATKDKAFVESITSGKFHNEIAAGVESAQSCMLGRRAAELGREVTWDEMQKSSEVYSLRMNIDQFK
ncbi:MAG TPA: Gfo/Idh/MocA family oxidoreductase [Terriglobales bacterium]|nr:Gfo/Idh/MocA family oxidoreductase [Terriglobales bacterium]